MVFEEEGHIAAEGCRPRQGIVASLEATYEGLP